MWKVHSIEIDPVTRQDDGTWYTYAAFSLVEDKRRKFLNKKIHYGLDDFLLLVCSPSIEKSKIEGLNPQEFKKRLELPAFSTEEIETYIKSKVEQAVHREQQDIFTILAEDFYLDDH